MKNQYFGDRNDYYKYGLLRLIINETNLKIGVCWMLTQDDGKEDGNKITYLLKPKKWRHYDLDLYDLLKYYVYELKDRKITNIENERYMPNCKFHSLVIEDDVKSRKQYFNNLKKLTVGCDLLFFDPDNGMEVTSRTYGQKDSSKYLYWHEAKELYNLGFSLLIFQYDKQHIFYSNFINELRLKCQEKIGINPFYIYRAGHFSLILLAQRQHEKNFEKINEAIETDWAGKIKIYP